MSTGFISVSLSVTKPAQDCETRTNGREIHQENTKKRLPYKRKDEETNRTEQKVMGRKFGLS